MIKQNVTKLQTRLVTLARTRVVKGDAKGKTDAEYSKVVAELAKRTKKDPKLVRLWARRRARSDSTH